MESLGRSAKQTDRLIVGEVVAYSFTALFVRLRKPTMKLVKVRHATTTTKATIM